MLFFSEWYWRIWRRDNVQWALVICQFWVSSPCITVCLLSWRSGPPFATVALPIYIAIISLVSRPFLSVQTTARWQIIVWQSPFNLSLYSIIQSTANVHDSRKWHFIDRVVHCANCNWTVLIVIWWCIVNFVSVRLVTNLCDIIPKIARLSACLRH